MKAEELMIGDWVKCKDPKCEGHQIDLIDLGNEEVGLDGEIYNFEDIYPIPLTPEILKKSNILYEKSSYHYVIDKNKDLECIYYITQASQEDWVVGVDTGAYECPVFATIKYVHEIQHVLRLCKIDKKIIV